MDIYTRRIIDWIFQSSIRKIDLIKMISRIDLTHGLKGVTVRNDNGSQFIANKVRHYLRYLEANQEFTHIATPEETRTLKLSTVYLKERSLNALILRAIMKPN